MKIYLIEKKEVVKPYSSELARYGEVIVLSSGESDIEKYTELFEDGEDKIIGLNTGIIEWNFPVETILKIKNLKGICTKSTWADYLDLKYCRENDIVVSNLAGYNSQSVAEYAVWMMLSLARKLPLQIDLRFRVELNEKMLQTEIEGKRMGVLGLGSIGSRIAKMGQGLGMEVVYWSKNSRNQDYQYLELEEVMQTSDFIFVSVQTLEGTKGFLNKKRLDLLQPSAFVISVIGGMGYGVEDNKYLVQMVKEGKLAGYAVEDEHKPGYDAPEFNGSENIFVPGNYAYYTKESQKRGMEMWIRNLISMSKGDPINIVN